MKVSTLTSVFLIVAASLISNQLHAQSCLTNRIDKYAKVVKVFDGDTVKLASGEKVRFIGINAPEMNYKTKNPEPYAREAMEFVTSKILNQRVGLRYGAEHNDNYGRVLAHIFLEDGSNLQAMLLQQGLAINIAIPPNIWQQKCYQSLETSARKKQQGLWKNKYFQPLDAKKINQSTTGFHHVTGVVNSISITDKSLWLNLTSQMSLRISKKDMTLFDRLDVKQLQGKQVIAKGWINYQNKRFSMRLKHPSSLEIL